MQDSTTIARYNDYRIATDNKGIIQEWQKEVPTALMYLESNGVKAYVIKKIDKLFDDLLNNDITGIDITYRDIEELTTFHDGKRSKFSDYLDRIDRNEDPTVFDNGLENSKLLKLLNLVYSNAIQQVLERKLNQAEILQGTK